MHTLPIFKAFIHIEERKLTPLICIENKFDPPDSCSKKHEMNIEKIAVLCRNSNELDLKGTNGKTRHLVVVNDGIMIF